MDEEGATVPVITPLARSLTTSLMIAAAAGSCGSSRMRAADVSDGALFCAQALPADCPASSSLKLAGYCSLNMGIQSACNLCAAPAAGQGCSPAVLGQGTNYEYLQILGVDTADVSSTTRTAPWSPGCIGARAGSRAGRGRRISIRARPTHCCAPPTRPV